MSFAFEAQTTSSTPITKASPTVKIPKLGYSIAGLTNTNGTSGDPHTPFVPISITIKNCSAAAGVFNIAVKDERNSESLAVSNPAPNIPANGTSAEIKISGNKTNGEETKAVASVFWA